MKQEVSYLKRLLSALLAALLCLSLAACNRSEESQPEEPTPQQTQEEPEQTPAEPEEVPAEEPEVEQPWTWPTDTPENQGISQSALESIHSTIDSFPLLSSMIIKNGYLVDTYFKEGYDETSMFVLNSASKSVTSALIGIAIDQGHIESVDVPISNYFPQVLQKEDPAWQQITIHHLLTHTSGIQTTDEALWEQWRNADNWVDYILAQPIVATPGEVFSYSTGNTHLLSAILEQATGMTLYDYGKQYLFDPVGMDSVRIDTDPQGIGDGGNGIWMTTSDMAKFGQLFLNEGQWEGQQVVPASWVEESASLQYQRNTGSADYGYQWWVRTFGAQDYDAFFAQGHAGQYIFVVPQLQLVVAFTSDYTGATSIYWQLVNDIVAACDAV